MSNFGSYNVAEEPITKCLLLMNDKAWENSESLIDNDYSRIRYPLNLVSLSFQVLKLKHLECV